MKKSVKRLMASVFALVITLALVVTTTYAWFTLSSTPKVDGLNLTVTATDGLYVSATGLSGSYKSVLSSQDVLNAFRATKLDPVAYVKEAVEDEDFIFRGLDNNAVTRGFIEAVGFETGSTYYKEGATATQLTTIYTVEEFNMAKVSNIALYTGPDADTLTAVDGLYVFDDEDLFWTKTVVATEIEDSQDFEEFVGDLYEYQALYYEFKLYFRSNSQYKVFADLTNSSTTTTVPATTKLTEVWASDLVAADYLTQDFIDTTPAMISGGNLVQGYELPAYAANAMKIGFFDGDTLKGVYETADSVNESIYIPNNTTDKENIALDYFNYMNSTNYTSPVAGLFPTTANTGDVELITLSADAVNGGYQGSITIRIWLDGWDSDCFNSILDHSVATLLQFKGTAV